MSNEQPKPPGSILDTILWMECPEARAELKALRERAALSDEVADYARACKYDMEDFDHKEWLARYDALVNK